MGMGMPMLHLKRTSGKGRHAPDGVIPLLAGPSGEIHSLVLQTTVGEHCSTPRFPFLVQSPASPSIHRERGTPPAMC